MKEYLKRLPKEIQEILFLAGNIASYLDMHAYLVGGFIRDLILKEKNFDGSTTLTINPERSRRVDLDIVVEGNGIHFAEEFSSKLGAKLTRHRRFGTATALLNPELKVDIATARKEFYPSPASLPEVEPGSLRDDLFRRDFTINAMAISIGQEDFGKIIDLFGGREDLNQKKIRILHDLSFIDDPTRLLRAVRFEQRFHFKIENHTLKLLKEAARQKMLEIVQPQRLRDELILMLKEDNPLCQIKRVKELLGFRFINQNFNISKKDYSFFNRIAKEVDWFKKEYHRRRQLDIWLIYLMALMGSLDINQTRKVCKKFAFSRGEGKRLISYKQCNSEIAKKLNRNGIKPAEVFSLLEPLSYEAVIMLKAKCRNLNIQRRIRDFLEIYNGMRLNIRGEDLRKLGLAPGPLYKKIFTKVLKAKLNGLAGTKEEEVFLINKLIRKR